MNNVLPVALFGFLAVLGFVILIVLLNFGAIWIRAWSSGAPVGFMELISLKLRKVPVGMVVDAILVIGFFVLLFSLLRSHVPSNDPKMVVLWAGLTSACMSGVFWLAIQMFRVVLSAQLLAKKLKR
jgi:uncharacterized protein YqfA (UPF0365 family)